VQVDVVEDVALVVEVGEHLQLCAAQDLLLLLLQLVDLEHDLEPLLVHALDVELLGLALQVLDLLVDEVDGVLVVLAEGLIVVDDLLVLLEDIEDAGGPEALLLGLGVQASLVDLVARGVEVDVGGPVELSEAVLEHLALEVVGGLPVGEADLKDLEDELGVVEDEVDLVDELGLHARERALQLRQLAFVEVCDLLLLRGLSPLPLTLLAGGLLLLPGSLRHLALLLPPVPGLLLLLSDSELGVLADHKTAFEVLVLAVVGAGQVGLSHELGELLLELAVEFPLVREVEVVLQLEELVGGHDLGVVGHLDLLEELHERAWVVVDPVQPLVLVVVELLALETALVGLEELLELEDVHWLDLLLLELAELLLEPTVVVEVDLVGLVVILVTYLPQLLLQLLLLLVELLALLLLDPRIEVDDVLVAGVEVLALVEVEPLDLVLGHELEGVGLLLEVVAVEVADQLAEELDVLAVVVRVLIIPLRLSLVSLLQVLGKDLGVARLADLQLTPPLFLLLGLPPRSHSLLTILHRLLGLLPRSSLILRGHLGLWREGVGVIDVEALVEILEEGVVPQVHALLHWLDGRHI